MKNIFRFGSWLLLALLNYLVNIFSFCQFRCFCKSGIGIR
ncbi:hypothetical protein PAM_638 [Onion yellows phytoplasma OY-M]|uniref:Uncharacterized protein n=1 Tax=Onion yellows phytoplasma (strain OY-M) TaxID=262768 RepID=Q6YPT7_ONYPE|nr:hypothetical protein PAM_638 [Onion yellows phytoplasma OY-M]